MPASLEAAWSPPADSDDGYATKIGGSIVDQFVLGHEPTDVLRELVQNEFDADGEVMAVTFGTEQLSISGSGRPINKKGWDRLDVVIGTGRVAGDLAGAKIEPKENGIGSKNFGLRSLFLFGDRIYVRSNGRRAVQNLIRLATKVEPDAVDLLVYGYRREHGTIRFLHQHEIMDRLRSIEHVRFVTGIDRHYTLGGKTVGITTEAAAIDGDIALKPTRTKFEFEQNLTYALAELLGATQVSDARRLSVALLPLLMCESSADMFAYLERQGLKPSSWTESALPAVDPIAEADTPTSPEQTVIQTLLTQMFDQAATAGPDDAPAPAAAPTAASTPPPPPARTTFELPSLDLVTPSIERPTDHALAARPPAPSGGGWYTSGSSNWRPPDAYDVDRDQKVGARGEEIVYLAELERVRAFGHERPEDHVIWVSRTQPGADHDIRSIDKHGKPLWLEVKSTMGTDGRFDWPQREFEKALRERDRYILWRVYEAHTTHPVAKAFVNPAALLARSMLRVELSGMVGFVESR